MSGIPLASQFSLGATIPLDDRAVVADVTTIPTSRRYIGMLVFQTGTNNSGKGFYYLDGGTANVNWTLFTGSGGGGGGTTTAIYARTFMMMGG